MWENSTGGAATTLFQIWEKVEVGKERIGRTEGGEVGAEKGRSR